MILLHDVRPCLEQLAHVAPVVDALDPILEVLAAVDNERREVPSLVIVAA